MHSMGCSLFPIHSELPTKIVILLVVLTLGAHFGAVFALFLSGFLSGFFLREFIIFGILSGRRHPPAFGPDCPMDYHPEQGDNSISSKCVLETESMQDHQGIIRSICYGSQETR